jgi:hypothetical protein
MASRGSVRAQARKLLADELALLLRFGGLLMRLMLAGLAYKFCLIECLPGQYANAILASVIALNVVTLVPQTASKEFVSIVRTIAERGVWNSEDSSSAEQSETSVTLRRAKR